MTVCREQAPGHSGQEQASGHSGQYLSSAKLAVQSVISKLKVGAPLLHAHYLSLPPPH